MASDSLFELLSVAGVIDGDALIDAARQADRARGELRCGRARWRERRAKGRIMVSVLMAVLQPEPPSGPS